MSDTAKPEKESSGDINVGAVRDSVGVAIGHRAQAIVNQGGPPADAIAKAFQQIQEKIQALPESPAKTDAAEAAQKLEAEARKGDQADRGRLERWLGFLADTAPDAWDVAVTTFANPVAGVGKVFQLVAAKAKESQARPAAPPP